jgi:hypothetical protein
MVHASIDLVTKFEICCYGKEEKGNLAETTYKKLTKASIVFVAYIIEAV